MMKAEHNTIIPTALFNGKHGEELDLEAIAFFCASGFFAENDTYWKEGSWDAVNFEKQPWEHKPRTLSLADAVDEFAVLFHQIVEEQVEGKKIILPLSGGLDSRSLAVALKNLNKTAHTYSYRFKGSFAETKYGKEIAKVAGWSFEDLEIPPSYMWDSIDESARINKCYAEFTHARQIAVTEALSKKGDVWLLGHWGDVLFDDMGITDDCSDENQRNTLVHKILKKGGKELADDLWKAWGLNGSFETTLRLRLEKMHGRIDIKNANAKVRAFKSLYWATRWTSTNLHYFNHYKPMALPYYDDRMCRFIMSLPEEHLAGRKIQIEYIKKYAPDIAAVPWQDKAPYNLFEYHKQFTPQHLPYRIKNKVKNVLNEKVLRKKLIQRNWEIQFLGKENDAKLNHWLFENEAFKRLVPEEITRKYYTHFIEGDQVYWSHPVSILLTLSVFSKHNAFKI
jgi:asparagine synthetase B (glutamine-hydrolysing)